MSLFNLSRYWNRFAYLIIDLGRSMVWDYTGKNADILKYPDDDCTREIMTYIHKDKR